MVTFCKDFFTVQLQFAKIISEKNKIPLRDTLFLYTSLYVRFLGFSDENPPTRDNSQWVEILSKLPQREFDQINYIYNRYLQYEENKPSIHTLPSSFGCFSYTYHRKDSMYELHFSPVDPHGNLGKDRIKQRIADLTQLFSAIKKEDKNTSFFVRTWLLNIEAFNRLFPKEFTNTAKKWDKNLAQDNSHWGQFLTRNGEIKKELVEKLLKKANKERYIHINDYFPLPALYAQTSLTYFYSFYPIDI